MLVDHSYDNNITEKSQYHNKISTDFLTFIRENKSPRKHKDGLRWYKTVLIHLIPSKR